MHCASKAFRLSFGCGENVVMMENCGNENKRDDGSGSKLLGGDG